MTRWETFEDCGEMPGGWWAEFLPALRAHGIEPETVGEDAVQLPWPDLDEGEEMWAGWGIDPDKMWLVRHPGTWAKSRDGQIVQEEPVDRADPEQAAGCIAEWMPK
ncbi:hypothetical protein [Kineosporia sp. NBRC 101731]|uniref:hypothetical protein n=1 Tax=Kineosporia sp. NBRC 101731 TaxID=3032199 RepID=UPI0024A205BF|nr:hypothetical protein [Kineosporia sp. NBRC 101731]GLY32087.1 hypothetical protein Kisp02_54520 [Kineosporia sp. NBRC 101731]